jgi:hypothetical protein
MQIQEMYTGQSSSMYVIKCVDCYDVVWYNARWGCTSKHSYTSATREYVAKIPSKERTKKNEQSKNNITNENILFCIIFEINLDFEIHILIGTNCS